MLDDWPVRELLRDAVTARTGQFRRDVIHAFFNQHDPRVKKSTVDAHITSATVNDRNRRHFVPAGDLLFKNPYGRYERYDPTRHGRWSAAGEPLDDMAALARDRPPSRRRRSKRRTQRLRERVEDLVSGFDAYVNAFEEDVGFSGPSVYFHRLTVDELHSHGSVVRLPQALQSSSN